MGSSQGFNATLRLNRLNGVNGFQLTGPAQYSNFGKANFGRVVSSGYDINGDGWPDLIIGAPETIGRYGQRSVGAIWVVLGCGSKNSPYLTSFDLIGSDTQGVIQALSFYSNKIHQLQLQSLKIRNGELSDKQIFLNNSASISQSQPLMPKLALANATHFLLQSVMQTGVITQLKTQLLSVQDNVNIRIDTLRFGCGGKQVQGGLWQYDSNVDSAISICVTISFDSINRFHYSVRGYTLHRLSQSPNLRLLPNVQNVDNSLLGMSSHLQYGLLNTDIPMIFLYRVRVTDAEVRAILYPTPTHREFTISESITNLGVSPNYFILSLRQPFQMAYVYPENIVHGPLWYQKFIYENRQLSRLGARKELLPITPFQQTTIVSFPDRSFMVIYLDNQRILSQLFTQDGDVLGGLTPLATISGRPWIETLKSTPINHEDYAVAWHWIRNNTHDVVTRLFRRHTLWPACMNCTYETTTRHYMDEDVSKIFINTLSSLNKSMTCQSQLLQGTLQLQKDCRLTGFTPLLPTRLKFNITANNTLMSLSKELTIEVKLPNLLWLGIALGVGAIGTALFSAGLFSACLMWRRYVRQEEKWGKPLGTLHRSFWEKEMLKNFVSFIDNETMVSRQHPVVSLVGNIKSTVPNHVYIILESIDDLGQMMIERFELVTPTQPVTSKKTKDEIRVETVQEKVDESIVESTNVILSDVSLDKSG